MFLEEKQSHLKAPLPLNLLAIAGRMRAEIDGLSNQLMESGYFDTSKGIESIQKNLGQLCKQEL